ncbi:uncharacterized protein UV8b_03244 [Ustilaginoidea virens]|uniref:Uncharacterized protein n=1 Tax=Ustilaginoidea virens TaxID=1159556 RepID=A0A063BTG7_USTVR|nr:uncharacterized protein UV8b_03244 [Ustilaginoidea virens]QUC19003.1 hypothetical protein UV8b_03244 [Ustilaginoidea virens]GAO17893.1 hypothetical protein UVI_02030100 [Ustilaginoidea virens]
MDQDHASDTIVPPNAAVNRGYAPRVKARLRRAGRALTTRDGLLGDYDYAFLFRPNLPFMTKTSHRSPFFGLNDRMPVLLGMLLGLQHALAMLAGVIAPPLILGGAGGANLETAQLQYLVSTALIVSGLLSSVQIARVRIPKTKYFIGTGVLSVVGISFSIIPIGQGAFRQMYASGFCPSDARGNLLPCPQGYGALIGTSAICAITEILISFLPPKVLLKVFPPIVTGPTVMLIGIHLVEAGFKDWMGGSGPCSNPAASGAQAGLFALCPNINAPHALPWGSPEYLGLGFAVFITIIICERFGSPIVKSTSVIWGLLVGCIIAAACGYFNRAGIDSAPVVSFIWVHTFPLSVYGPLVLPIMAVFVVCATEAVGDITATCDVSLIELQGRTYESRIQSGLLTDGINGIAAALMTMTPMSRFAQNNGVIALTRCANRKAGLACCLFLVIMGIFAKFAAALVAIPSSVLGGMTTFLFSAVAVSGMAIINRGTTFDRRTRFILTAGLALGYGATLVPTYFDRIFTYSGGNHALKGLLDAVVLVMETGFAVTAAVCMALNLALPEELDDNIDARAVDLTVANIPLAKESDADKGKVPRHGHEHAS